MIDKHNDVVSPEKQAERAVWEQPEMRRLEAGTAEAGGLTLNSDGATFS